MSDIAASNSTSGFDWQHDSLARAVAVCILIYCLVQAFSSWVHDVERRHRRAQLLAAYRKRHSWKRSDIKHLQVLGVNLTALRRIQRLTGTGRPVVKPPQQFDVAILNTINAVNTLFNPEATAIERKQALKFSPWWRHHVEALYRGEHAQAKIQRVRNPSGEAEQNIAQALCLSVAKVHAMCGAIRRNRKGNPGSANFPPMTLVEFDRWMMTGVYNIPDNVPKLIF
jgi:hypothetical protein